LIYSEFVATLTPKEYHNNLGYSFRPADYDHILHAILGIASESGEIVDVYKKQFAYGKPMDLINLDEEFGDLLWYIQLYANARGSHTS
jgi:NTP pyrophosphatase (non-canonical NTP hydrolase)